MHVTSTNSPGPQSQVGPGAGVGAGVGTGVGAGVGAGVALHPEAATHKQTIQQCDCKYVLGAYICPPGSVSVRNEA